MTAPVPAAPDPAGHLPPGALDALPEHFYLRPVLEVARDLLGRLFVREHPEGTTAIRIVEVEAYAGAADPASHAFRGPTARNGVMFGPPGHLYVYFTYGVHWCANVVCAPRGTAEAVLLRAGQPVLGADLMATRRFGPSRPPEPQDPGDFARAPRPGAKPARPTRRQPRDLTGGPARLTQALAVDGRDNGASLLGGPGSPVRLTAGSPVDDDKVTWTGRVGIRTATDRPWRVLDATSPWVSPGRPGPSQPRRRP